MISRYYFTLGNLVNQDTTVLTTIVGATVGLTGFVVTVTVLAIQMATGTFSARYMRIWYRDRLLKAVLTVLAGTVRSSAQALVAAVAIAALLALIRAARVRQPIAAWWRPAVALLLAPLGLLGYWG